MKKENIYIGTIKKCLDLENYFKYGDSQYKGNFKINNAQYGHIRTYTQIIETDIILIKIGKNKFFPIYDSDKMNIISVILGIDKNVLTTNPNLNNPYFIDESTLKHYYPEEERAHRLTYKTLKSHTL